MSNECAFRAMEPTLTPEQVREESAKWMQHVKFDPDNNEIKFSDAIEAAYVNALHPAARPFARFHADAKSLWYSPMVVPLDWARSPLTVLGASKVQIGTVGVFAKHDIPPGHFVCFRDGSICAWTDATRPSRFCVKLNAFKNMYQDLYTACFDVGHLVTYSAFPNCHVKEVVMPFSQKRACRMVCTTRYVQAFEELTMAEGLEVVLDMRNLGGQPDVVVHDPADVPVYVAMEDVLPKSQMPDTDPAMMEPVRPHRFNKGSYFCYHCRRYLATTKQHGKCGACGSTASWVCFVCPGGPICYTGKFNHLATRMHERNYARMCEENMTCGDFERWLERTKKAKLSAL